MPFRLVLGLSLLCLACGEGPLRGMAVQSIVNGTPDDGDPAVVALTYRGYAFCTGTVIAPRYVVTAAHCLADVPVPMTTCEVFFGSDLAMPGESIAIAEAIPHPAFDHASPTFEVNDIAVLRLASPTQVPPVRLARAALGPGSIGQEMRIVGFGRTSPDGSVSGVKRQGKAHVLELGGTFFSMSVSPSATGKGDSGGPAFTLEEGVEVLAGIHARGNYTQESDEERVDLHTDHFLAPFVAPEDAGELHDAARPGPDAAGPGPDAANLDPDVGVPTPDCGLQATAGSDAGTVAVPGSEGCSSAGGGGALPVGVLALLGVGARMTRRP